MEYLSICQHLGKLGIKKKYMYTLSYILYIYKYLFHEQYINYLYRTEKKILIVKVERSLCILNHILFKMRRNYRFYIL